MDTAIREYYINSYLPGIAYLKDSDLDTVRSIGGQDATFRFLAEKAKRYVSGTGATATVGTVPYGEDTVSSLTTLMTAGTLEFVKIIVAYFATVYNAVSSKITYTLPTNIALGTDSSTVGGVTTLSATITTMRNNYISAFASLVSAISTANTTKIAGIDSIKKSFNSKNIPTNPSVATGLVKSLTGKQLQVSGKILAIGSSAITERGFVWSKQENPTVANGTKVLGTASVDFNGTITGTDPIGTIYYIRAYATTAKGTFYGSQVRGTLMDVPAAPTLGTIAFAKPANMQQTSFMDPDDLDSQPLYNFTTHTFTTLGASGPYGPSSLSQYGTNIPGHNTPYILKLSEGIQMWTVPLTGDYEFDIAGARGGGDYSGNGVRYTFKVKLTRGKVIKILVGQRGLYNANNNGTIGGGGGGTFIVFDNETTPITSTNMSNYIIAIAGGGGGEGNFYNKPWVMYHATTQNLGKYSFDQFVGSPPIQTEGSGGYNAGGGGMIGNGSGKSFINGGSGSSPSTVSGITYANGGFGGGGHAYTMFASAYNKYYIIGGGGGGYSGGAAYSSAPSYGYFNGPGGGAGSYISLSASNITSFIDAKGNAGDGYVKITSVPPPPTMNPTFSISATIPTNQQILSAGFIWGQTKNAASAAALIETLRNRSVQYPTQNLTLSGITLKGDANYRLRAYAKNRYGITYSPETTFLVPTPLTVTTVVNWTKTNAFFTVAPTIVGTPDIKGFLYSRTVISPAFNADGSLPTDVFKIEFTGSSYNYDYTVSTVATPPNLGEGQYYIRAYASNIFGLEYGTVISGIYKHWLYDFISPFTFTSCGTSGSTGPGLTTCRNTYFNSAPWTANDAYFSMTTKLSGIQVWTVPVTGTYRMIVAGGSGAAGAAHPHKISASFTLTKGTKINILVGHSSTSIIDTNGGSNTNTYYNYSTGGATYIVKNGSTAISDIYLIAAGGPSAYYMYKLSGAPMNIGASSATVSSEADSVASNSYAGGPAGFNLNGKGGAVAPLSYTSGGTGSQSASGNGPFGGGLLEANNKATGGPGFSGGMYSYSSTPSRSGTSFCHSSAILPTGASQKYSITVDGTSPVSGVSINNSSVRIDLISF
jgi:hypothetical protein